MLGYCSSNVLSNAGTNAGSNEDWDTHENVNCHKKAVMPRTKKSTHMAKLMWDSTNKAGQALIKAVYDGIIDEDIPSNLMKKTNKLWKDYDTTPFCCALCRA